jgi:plastocyanin
MKLGNVVKGLLVGAATVWLGAASARAATSHTVMMGTYFFNPTNITVMQGDTIVWTNRATIAHDTTQGAFSTPTAQRLWISPNVSASIGSYRFSFTNMGFYPYICLQHISLHPEQTGSVTVVHGNLPPTVTLTAPAGGSRHPTPTRFPAAATASDPDGTVTNVFFTATASSTGTFNLGSVSAPPYTIVVTNLPATTAVTYSFRAVAVDNEGLSTTSSPPVSVQIVTPVPLILSTPGLPSQGQWQVVFPTTQGLSYVLEETGDLGGPWRAVSTNIGPVGSGVVVTNSRPFDASSPAQKFYRAYILP